MQKSSKGDRQHNFKVFQGWASLLFAEYSVVPCCLSPFSEMFLTRAGLSRDGVAELLETKTFAAMVCVQFISS